MTRATTRAETECVQFAYVPLGQAECDVNRGAGIDWAAVHRLRGLETNAECRPFGRFVQAMTKSAHDAQHTDVASGSEFQIERHGALYAGAARFVGVLRRRLEDDLDRPVDWPGSRRLEGRTRSAIKPGRP